MEEERRQNPRTSVNWSVTIQTEEGTVERATYNISPDGAFIRGLSPLELHEVVDMNISGPDQPITVKARVVWSNCQVPPDGDMPRGVGVEFINISDEHREIIFSLVSEDIEPSGPDEDEKEQSSTKEQSLIEEEILIEEQPVEEEKQDMKKPALGPPKNCPDGHKHISWSMGDDHIFCWDCNRRYPLAACFQPSESSSSEPGSHLKEEEAEK
jgi:hypothetical protein